MEPSLYSRREFTRISLAGIAAVAFPTGSSNIRAIAFDAFVIFDPKPVLSIARQLFGEQGQPLFELWRSKQFEYTWLMTSAGKFQDFMRIAEDALIYAVARLNLILSAENKSLLLAAYNDLDIWPDVVPALKQLKEAGFKLVLLSNFTVQMLERNVQKNDLSAYFDYLLSSDMVKKYKPAPEVYQLGTRYLKLRKEQVLFAAFAPWDVAGAKWFGYKVYWVNRAGAAPEEISSLPDSTGKNMHNLYNWLNG